MITYSYIRINQISSRISTLAEIARTIPRPANDSIFFPSSKNARARARALAGTPSCRIRWQRLKDIHDSSRRFIYSYESKAHTRFIYSYTSHLGVSQNSTSRVENGPATASLQVHGPGKRHSRKVARSFSRPLTPEPEFPDLDVPPVHSSSSMPENEEVP